MQRANAQEGACDTAQQSSGNRGGYDDAKLRFYESSRGLTSLTVGDRAICPRPLLSATQSVPRACIVDVKLASASASAYRRSRGVEHVFDLTGWARTAAHRRRADPPASTDRRVGRARSRARCYECLWALHIQQYSRVSVIFTHRVGVRCCECA